MKRGVRVRAGSVVKPNPRGVYVRQKRIAPQEQRLLRLYSMGFSDRECAQRMRRSRSTIRDTKRRLFDKLGASTKREIVRNAMRKGIAA